MTDQSLILRSDGSELTRWIWCVLPITLAIIVWSGFFSLERSVYEYWFESETGFIELTTPLVLFVAIGYGVSAYRLRKYLSNGRLGIWLLMVTAGCIYFAGEDLSWGQHLFGWETPEKFKDLNDQMETNLHNISPWFDQKPRWMLEVWLIIGGIFVAGWRKWKGELFESNGWQYWFWPGFACFPAALLAELVRFPERVKKIFDIASLPTDLRYSELQELMFACFLLCYLASCYQRLKLIESKT